MPKHFSCSRATPPGSELAAGGAAAGRKARVARPHLAAALLLALGSACSREPPPGATANGPGATPAASGPEGRDAALLAALENAAGSASAAPASSTPSSGSEVQVGVFAPQPQIYAGPSSKEPRIGYLRRGAKVAADATQVTGEGCAEGWYKLAPYGYLCGKNGTTDLNNPQVRLGVVAPKLGDVLPYTYAHNVTHGTPLYKSVPTREEMAYYEPYLNMGGGKPHAEAGRGGEHKHRKKKKHRDDDDDDRTAERPAATTPPLASSPPALTPPPAASGVVAATTALTAPTTNPPPAPEGGAAGAAGAGDAPDATRPWWAQKYEGGKGPDLKLSDLQEDSDGLLSKRMMRGFYVAVDRTFSMNQRTWYKTTNGLIAPADRFGVVKASDFAGQEIDEPHASNPVAFVLAKQATKYEIDTDKNSAKAIGALERFDRAFLTGKTATLGGRPFRETVDGWWVRASEVTTTDPGPPPADLKPGERWVDVNLARQTLVAFEGTRPVFATLVSSGRKGADKEHDHTTPTGTWRIREKHLAATMDGDGAASGDMPYSIEDVPYIMYFFESYALHGAFWHDDYGHPHSHGCVNLSPLDAKRLFYWSDPQVPQGWHGRYASPDMPGSRVVVHNG